MAAVVQLRLQFDGDARRFLQDVASLVETIKAAREDSEPRVSEHWETEPGEGEGSVGVGLGFGCA